MNPWYLLARSIASNPVVQAAAITAADRLVQEVATRGVVQSYNDVCDMIAWRIAKERFAIQQMNNQRNNL